jgi:hypothetical protein
MFLALIETVTFSCFPFRIDGMLFGFKFDVKVGISRNHSTHKTVQIRSWGYEKSDNKSFSISFGHAPELNRVILGEKLLVLQ